MSDFQQKPTGTQYTMTVALLIMALIFSPAVLIVSRPFEYFSVSVALVSSGLCLALAWVTWKRSSQLTIPSIAPQDGRAK